MTDISPVVKQARMRLERAVNTIRDTIAHGELEDRETNLVILSRIVIFTNTIATGLQQASDGNGAVAEAADLLWKLGEGLGIDVDEGRAGIFGSNEQ